ncbi:hypothetical protein F5880DRAFT_1505884 [Lentinula raphanica]|nr:hypothetical protein F5880DRAFT_1505884 [Lentinula raphanica]
MWATIRTGRMCVGIEWTFVGIEWDKDNLTTPAPARILEGILSSSSRNERRRGEPCSFFGGITTTDRTNYESRSKAWNIWFTRACYYFTGKLKNETAYLDTANGLQCPTFGGDTICQLARGGWSFVEPFSTQKSDRSANFDILPCDRDEKERRISSGSLHVGDTPVLTTDTIRTLRRTSELSLFFLLRHGWLPVSNEFHRTSSPRIVALANSDLKHLCYLLSSPSAIWDYDYFTYDDSQNDHSQGVLRTGRHLNLRLTFIVPLLTRRPAACFVGIQETLLWPSSDVTLKPQRGLSPVYLSGLLGFHFLTRKPARCRSERPNDRIRIHPILNSN